MLRGKILIGYGRTRKVMGLSHPAIDTRDAALFLPFRRSLRYRSNVQVPLVTLVNRFMGRNIGLHGDFPVCARARPLSRSSLAPPDVQPNHLADTVSGYRSNTPALPSTYSVRASRSGKA